MGAFLQLIWRFLRSLAPLLGQLAIGVGVSMALTAYADTFWGDIFAKIDAMAGGDGTADFSALSLINYVFPLDTMLNFLTLYMSLSVTAAFVRIVRAHLTKSNG